jgi:hypothetical protein
MSLPIGLIPGSLTIIPSEGGSCGDAGSLAVYIYRGEAEFNFNLAPELLALQLSHLNLGIWNDSGMLVLPTITIFDFEEQAWTNLDNLSIGENTIPDPAAFVDANGLVRIRLNANQDSQGCFYVGLGLEAHTTEP